MDANEQLLNTFSTRVRQMILHYQRVCEENAALKADVAEREGRIAELERQLDQAQKDYNALMTARMIEISDRYGVGAEAHRQAHQGGQQMYHPLE